MTAPLSDDEIQAALAEALLLGSGGRQYWDREELREIAADVLPVVRDIAAREAARAVKATAMSLRMEGEFTAAERCDALGAALLAYPPRALGLDPTHGKATT
jgi:hypothetical protein